MCLIILPVVAESVTIGPRFRSDEIYLELYLYLQTIVKGVSLQTELVAFGLTLT